MAVVLAPPTILEVVVGFILERPEGITTTIPHKLLHQVGIVIQLRDSVRLRFVFLRQSAQFSSFGDDYLRLLTGLGEDGELRGSSLFATTAHLT
jgi:hypothetical protein